MPPDPATASRMVNPPALRPAAASRIERASNFAWCRHAARRPPDAVRQLHLQLQLQADAVPGARPPAVQLPHREPEIRCAEAARLPRDQPLRPGADAAPSRPD